MTRSLPSAELVGDAGTVFGDNRYATSEAGSPSTVPMREVGLVSLDRPFERPCDFRPVRQLLRLGSGRLHGSGVGGLSRVAQDDNDCPDYYGGRVSFNAAAGQEYRIAVDGAYGDQGDLTLTWNRAALAPQIHVSPSVVGNAVDGAMLTATVGEWGGTPPLTFGYQWMAAACSGRVAIRSRQQTVRPMSQEL